MPQSLTDPKIEIFLKSRRLRLFSGGQMVKEYPVAIGKPNTPTPPGNYAIRNKIMHPGGVYGTRWMEFKPRYGIHGTNYPASIGTMASLGCVRMFNHHVEELFALVRLGTPVIIMNEAISPHSNLTPAPQELTGTGPAGQRSYVVQPGDTLWRIAQQFNVTIEEILAVNNIPNPHRLTVGQVISLPY